MRKRPKAVRRIRTLPRSIVNWLNAVALIKNVKAYKAPPRRKS